MGITNNIIRAKMLTTLRIPTLGSQLVHVFGVFAFHNSVGQREKTQFIFRKDGGFVRFMCHD